jgi:hypothetical protein
MFRVCTWGRYETFCKGYFEQCSNVTLNIYIIFNFILEKLMELITTLEQGNSSHMFKEEK